MISSSLLHALLIAWATPHLLDIRSEPDPQRFVLPLTAKLNRSRSLKLAESGARRASFFREKARESDHRLPRRAVVSEPLEDAGVAYVVRYLDVRRVSGLEMVAGIRCDWIPRSVLQVLLNHCVCLFLPTFVCR
jgi:hypothetical protein